MRNNINNKELHDIIVGAVDESLNLRFVPDMEQRVEQIVEKASYRAAEEAIRTVLMTLGIDSSDHQQMRADMLYLRKLRNGSEYVGKSIMAGVVSAWLGAVLWMVWRGFKEWLER